MKKNIAAILCLFISVLAFAEKVEYGGTSYWIGPGQKGSMIEEEIKKRIDEDNNNKAEAARKAMEEARQKEAQRLEADQRAAEQKKQETERNREEALKNNIAAQSALSEAQRKVQQAKQNGISEDSAEFLKLKAQMDAAQANADAASNRFEQSKKDCEIASSAYNSASDAQRNYEQRLREEQKELEWLAQEQSFIVENLDVLLSNVSDEKRASIENLRNDPKTYAEFIKEVQSVPLYSEYKRYARDHEYSLEGMEPPVAVGDPVQLATGKYYVSLDLTDFPYGKEEFKINLFNVTGFSGTGAFGYGWLSSLDTCIVRGKAENLLSTYVSLINKKNKLSGLKNKLDNISILLEKALDVNNQIESSEAYLEAQAQSLESKMNAEQTGTQKNLLVSSIMPSELTDGGSDVLYHVSESGTVGIFLYDSSVSRWVCANNLFKENPYIVESEDGGYVLYETDGLVKEFNEYGQPVEFRNAYGSSICFKYDTVTKRLISVFHKKKKIISIEWNDKGFVDSVYNHLNNTKYSAAYTNNCLTGLQDSLGRTCFEYDSDSDLSRIIKSDSSYISIEYEPKETAGTKRVIRVQNEEGWSEYFSYNDEKNTLTYTDADGFSTEYFFNDSKQLVKELLADGSFVLRSYDEDGNMILRRDESGDIYYSYDSCGNIMQCTYPDGSHERWNYDSYANKLISHIDRDGVPTEYQYDLHGECTAVKRAGQTVLEIKRNEWGGISSIKGNGIDCTCLYDENYNLVSDGLVSVTYSADNKLSSVSDYFENESDFFYETDCNAETKTDSSQMQTAVVKNNRGDVIEEHKIDLLSGNAEVYMYTYDKRHLLVAAYSGYGQSLSSARNSMRCIAQFEYSPAGRLIKKTFWNEGAACEHDAPGISYAYTYNCKDQIVSTETYFVDFTGQKTGNSVETTYSYFSESGNAVCEVYKNQHLCNRITYDRNGKPVKVTDAEGRSVFVSYTPSGKVSKITNVYGGVESYVYDPVTGEIAGVIRDGLETEHFTYDSQGNLISCSQADGSETKYEYEYIDGLKRKTIRTALGNESVLFDNKGRSISHTVCNEQNEIIFDTSVWYDEKNRNAVLRTADSEKRYTFDMSGNQTGSSENGYELVYNSDGSIKAVFKNDGVQKSLVCTYAYTVFGQVSQIQYSDGTVYDYYYDVSGNLLTFKVNGKTVWQGTYTDAGKLQSEQGLLVPLRKYSYDLSGNLTSVSENGTVLFTYVYSDDMKTVFRYDALGNKTIFCYDEWGMLCSVTDRNGSEESFQENKRANSILSSDRNGKTRLIDYNPAQGQTVISYQSGREDVLQKDMMGRIVYGSKTDTDANSSVFFEYGLSNTLCSVWADGNQILYDYDSNGNKISQVTDSCSVSYSYDSDGRITEVQCGELFRRYSYSDNGKCMVTVDQSGTKTKSVYDELNRPEYFEVRLNDSQLVFAQGLLYDENGHISMEVVFSNGMIKILCYEYDENCRLTSVRQTLTDELIACTEREILQYGFVPEKISLYPPMNLSSGQDAFFRTITERMDVTQLPSLSCWTENYCFDASGNRIKKSTPLGSVVFSYDAENRLISSCIENRENSISYVYDDNGNLIEKKSLYKWETLEYTEDNRIKKYICFDVQSGSQSETSFSYDIFGRMIQKVNADGSVIHWLYDGVSFRKVKEWTDYQQMSASTHASDVRYRKLTDTSSFDARYFVYADNELAYQIIDGRPYSCFCDSHNSLRSCILSDGFIETLDYTADGMPLYSDSRTESNLFDHSYCGKRFDADMNAFDFGYRMYDPLTARFTTEDPERDSVNWYSYCNGNPVDYTDDLGLEVRIVVDMNNMTLEAQYIIDNEVILAISTDNGVRDPWQSPVTTAVKSGDTRERSDTSRSQSYNKGSIWTVPTKFPAGTWNVILDTNQTGIKNYGGFWLRTYAIQDEQLVSGKNGDLLDSFFAGSGYCVHMTKSSNTNGCVGIHEQYIMDALAEMMILNTAAGETKATIEIKYSNPYDSASVEYYSPKGGVKQPSKIQ